jgi:hypothetical protein
MLKSRDSCCGFTAYQGMEIDLRGFAEANTCGVPFLLDLTCNSRAIVNGVHKVCGIAGQGIVNAIVHKIAARPTDHNGLERHYVGFPFRRLDAARRGTAVQAR